ncbi:MAG: calcium/proton exchanger [Candidatus Zixiibacteriota bacterium]|jgi:Ca2+:H+ antiporter
MKYGSILLLFLPAAALSYYLGGPPVFTFFAAAVALIYLAAAMGWATEVLAARAGPTIGGLLNATLGNAAEFIIALVGVRAGLSVVVKASLTGSILGNSLLVLGMSFLVGGLRHKLQTFNVRNATMGATLMVLAVSALLMPSLLHYIGRGEAISEHRLSLAISIILVVAYVASIVFSLITHRHIFPHHRDKEEEGKKRPIAWASVVLGLTTVGIVAAAELLVAVVEPTAHALGWSDVFIGIVVVAVAGNAAENFAAILMAWRNRMDLAITITQGSSMQIALLVAPLIVIISYVWPQPLDLIFTPLEVAAVAVSMLICSLITGDGESNWFEGLLMLALYAILGVTFFFAA